METLQPKEIFGYIPHGLKVIRDNIGDIKTVNPFGLADLSDTWSIETAITGLFETRQLKPLLRNMSALIDPLPDETIPIVEIAKRYGYKVKIYILRKGSNWVSVKDANNPLHFEISWGETISVKESDGFDFEVEHLNLAIDTLDYLHEHMFDYRGLLDRGLAIDLNSVKER